MIDLSICIVAYNDAAEVLKAVETIEKYTPAEISRKIYVVDNSECFDEAYAGLNRYKDAEYLFSGENLGFGKGHNCVLNDLDSRFHAIVNPDIELKEDSFSKIISFMEEEGCGAVIPRLVDESGELQKAYRRELTPFDMFIRMFVKGGFKKRRAYHTLDDMDYSKPFEVPFAQGSFLVMQTALFKAVGGFDERYFLYLEDADLCKKINQTSRIMYFPGTEVAHRWEKGSHKSKKLLLIHIKSMLKYFCKWGF